VVIFDDFDDLLLLVGSNYGEDLTDDHFDEGGVVLYELILELVFVEVCSGSVIEGVLWFLGRLDAVFIVLYNRLSRLLDGKLVLKISGLGLEIRLIELKFGLELL
jgi:hypothetical protein